MDEMLAVIKLFAGNFVPRGFMECNGQTLLINNNAALFSLLGISYGGDGRQNFMLPDLRPLDEQGQKRPWNQGEPRSLICVEGIYPVRD
ncbi:phage tail protein [Pelodictyon phaeoclathratiforme]|jgi:microcystin-dependent protein|uniref:Tail Collar domain protein n=1 Tax=Pelodictyon phaeoclathratiforme (strain DSM 5477 / BU-1) TaxID=324925 RepID=B4SF14_PELPB|nr:tail fiber protein [Pelodictyon phaeoclathratiforme]ACF43161.1 Tail Collar domain protein [Pelodictyon phaeoclathratiforme BU-1]MBV5290602.1 tail fiber protein [Pelodictyon phaeoclathratiforme]